jgi:hypothetical protein
MGNFTEKDLVEFGNQLLSKKRTAKKNKKQVNDADLQNFYHKKNNVS